jgi:hypothetical protein
MLSLARRALLLLVALFPLLLPIPASAARAVHTDFYGLYFPAGLDGTGTDCPYTWMDPAFCIVEQGQWTELPSGHLRIRDMVVFELAFSWREADDEIEPRKTGYDIVTANANLDAALTGPTWGTWHLYNFADELMFTGTFTGKFLEGIPAVHFVGQGTGDYEGQHMGGDIGRVPDPYNMIGHIVDPPT